MTMLSPANLTRPQRLSRWFASDWLRPLNDREGWNAILGELHPMWSLDTVRARIIETVDENVDTRSLVLEANRHWQGFRAGQHVLLSVEIDGRTHQRAYSLSSSPQHRDRLRLTIRRQEQGRVSGHAHEQLKVGDVVTISQASGDFVLPEATPPKLLMIAGGSGITPIMSQLLDLFDRRQACDIQLIVCGSSARGFIFGDALKALARQWPRLNIHWQDSATNGRLTDERLQALVPDLDERHTMLCGPAPMMDAVSAMFAKHGLAAKLQTERFGPATAAPQTDGAKAQVIAGERAFNAAPDQPLLEAAELAGLNPRYGCRIGICHSCQCRKTSGRVRNLQTGIESDAPGEMIQICISSAVGDVQLDL